nr:transposase [Candidatus Njordarchaeota archaeon]
MRLTVRCGIIKLTKRKQSLLDREYDNLQSFLKGNKNVPLYSANKQQALRFFKTIKDGKEYPLSLRNDLIDLRKSKSFWFLKIPVYGTRGGTKIPIRPHREDLLLDFQTNNNKLCESKIVRKTSNNSGRQQYIAMLTFEFDAPQMRICSSVLAVDLGERFAATAVLLQSARVVKARFYGGEIRGIRRHFSWLRKRLQEQGFTQVVKRIGKKERRCVNAVLHNVSKTIVDLADFTYSVIVLGDLKGIWKRAKGKSKRLNRIVSSMPYYRLTTMIEYKARMKGIPVITTSEAYSSILCHICNNRGERKTQHGDFSQGRFICSICGEYNADLNAAINIGKKAERFLGYMPLNGAVCEPARTKHLAWKPHPLERGSSHKRFSPCCH